ncbi:hypothetical protein TNCV_1043701 [Trichonephila clavipes]|nr:hypothetical protein TNCV_1043701 [Trichonephila clavipes]
MVTVNDPAPYADWAVIMQLRSLPGCSSTMRRPSADVVYLGRRFFAFAFTGLKTWDHISWRWLTEHPVYYLIRASPIFSEGEAIIAHWGL